MWQIVWDRNQKAAIAKIEELKSKFETGKFPGGADYYGSPYPDVNDFLREINRVIKTMDWRID